VPAPYKKSVAIIINRHASKAFVAFCLLIYIRRNLKFKYAVAEISKPKLGRRFNININSRHLLVITVKAIPTE